MRASSFLYELYQWSLSVSWLDFLPLERERRERLEVNRPRRSESQTRQWCIDLQLQASGCLDSCPEIKGPACICILFSPHYPCIQIVFRVSVNNDKLMMIIFRCPSLFISFVLLSNLFSCFFGHIAKTVWTARPDFRNLTGLLLNFPVSIKLNYSSR